MRRTVQLFVGLFLYGFGISLIVSGNLGGAPWDVLTQGLSKQTGLSFGLITIMTSAVVLLFWIPLRQKPGFGTIANAVLVGPFADLGFLIVPETEVLWIRIVYLAAGILVLGAATGLYIGAHFGPGPRDGLMTGIHRRTGVKIWIARTAIELVVLAIGWLLGGVAGLGTVAFAVLIGPICGFTIPWFAVRGVSGVDADRAPEPPASAQEPAAA
ncbi:YczE/YyaS/YitT family protein [Agromyces archimandritae]|uniref:YitT family protein n=1 Tax=Agromyces archimandritae TaxID=2781962 RepID=A0A975FQD7_9MICO|nr:hypothetical protein [Agromyces archimandritae]QTX05788.1 hypothetical protein G127AT_06180 [Agromyces archimandritae]